MAAWDVGGRHLLLVVDEDDRLEGEAEDFVAPVRPAGRATGKPEAMRLGAAVIGKPHQLVDRRRQDEIAAVALTGAGVHRFLEQVIGHEVDEFHRDGRRLFLEVLDQRKHGFEVGRRMDRQSLRIGTEGRKEHAFPLDGVREHRAKAGCGQKREAQQGSHHDFSSQSGSSR